MHATLTLDDELLLKAQALSGLQKKSALVNEALKALIERESARRLASWSALEEELPEVVDRPPEDVEF